jgi:CRP-like cAMP-binding protein
MGAARKYDSEFVERAVRMYRDRLASGTDSKVGAGRHVGALLDVYTATLVELLALQVRRLSDHLLEALHVPADERIVRRLLEVCGRYDLSEAAGSVVVPLTQDAVGDLAGAASPTTSRVLRPVGGGRHPGPAPRLDRGAGPRGPGPPGRAVMLSP